MSQTKTTVSQPSPAGTSGQQSAPGSSTPRPKGLPLHKIYELPAPIRTFPLPSFYPNNPISLFHVLYAWTKQTFFPPPAEPSVVYEGIWSPESKSVNVVDEKSMRALWEQGFYGKGNLSRSEPNWLKREQVRRGLVPGQVSELVTANRREERRQMKWERAKSEQEAIRQLRIQEAQQASQGPVVDAVNTTDAHLDSAVNGHEPEASADAISLPELKLAPADLEAETEPESVVQEAASNVNKDASIITPNNGVVPFSSAEPSAATDTTGLANGVTSQLPVESTASHIGSATILQPRAAIESTQETEAVVTSETVLRPGDILPLPIPLTVAYPVGPTELLSLPNSHRLELQNGEREDAPEGVDFVINRDIIIQPGDVLPASVPPSLPAPVGPLELIRLPNSSVALLAADERITAAAGHERQLPSTSETIDAFSSAETEAATNHVVSQPLTNGSSYPSDVAPVGPLELLSLPNTHVSLVNGHAGRAINGISLYDTSPAAAQKLSTIHENDHYDGSAKASTGHLIKDLVNGINGDKVNGVDADGTKATPEASTDLPSTPKPLKRRKSVRFSPKVESATYQSSDPPSPSYALLNGKSIPPVNGTPLGPSVLETEEETLAGTVNGKKLVEPEAETSPSPIEIVNKEHLQLTSEEAFFLSFGLGALRVVDPTTKAAIPTADLLKLFRQYSYFPSRAADELQPDDGFLVHYAVYHHFRSLGWVPRAGIKFGVDWMLYAKGPVFDHAEFGAIVLPSYSDQWWKDNDRPLPRKTWHWLHGVVRVLSHVQKSLVLVYVDVPPPPKFDEALSKGGPAEVFKLYKIREVMVKRWSSNRNR